MSENFVNDLFDDFEDDFDVMENHRLPITESRVNIGIYHYKNLLVNEKQEKIFDMKDIQTKAESIEQIGLLQMPLVKPIGNQQAVILAGHKRVAAIRYLVEQKNRKDLEFIRCQEYKGDEVDDELALIDTNLEASQLSSYELMMAIGRKEELLKFKENGGTMRQVIAEKSHLNQTQIGYYLRCYKRLRPASKQLLREEKITMKQAIRLALEPDFKQEKIAKAMNERGLAYDDAVKQMYDDYLAFEYITEEQANVIIGVVEAELNSRKVPQKVTLKTTVAQLTELLGAKGSRGRSSMDDAVQFVEISSDCLCITGLGKQRKLTWPTVLKVMKKAIEDQFKDEYKFGEKAADQMTKRFQTKVEITADQIIVSYSGMQDLKRLLKIFDVTG